MHQIQNGVIFNFRLGFFIFSPARCMNWELTEHGFETDGAQDEVVEVDLTGFVAVSHHETFERRVTHEKPCIAVAHHRRVIWLFYTSARLVVNHSINQSIKNRRTKMATNADRKAHAALQKQYKWCINNHKEQI